MIYNRPILALSILSLILITISSHSGMVALENRSAFWPSRHQTGDLNAKSVDLPHTILKATHNSYSIRTGNGNGSLTDQLQDGVRLIELDIHSSDFENYGDFRIGHWYAGHSVNLAKGNPKTIFLRDWLMLICDWSMNHRNHAPLIVLLDIKDNLVPSIDNHHKRNNQSPKQQGTVDFLDTELRAIFSGNHFYTASEFLNQDAGIWPSIDSLRGRILIVLSGDFRTRDYYVLNRKQPYAFVEYQPGEQPWGASHHLQFFAAPAKSKARPYSLDHIVRWWNFDTPTDQIPKLPWLVNLPATNSVNPNYLMFLSKLGAID